MRSKRTGGNSGSTGSVSGNVVDLSLAAATPSLGRAQSLVHQAWESPDPMDRISLAKQALKVSPDCADAYGILAEDSAQTWREALAFYRQSAAAAERVLGEQVFAEDEGHFWGLIETRPYMRAQLGIADCLVEAGQFAEAAAVLQRMLALNPSDNQGVRYLLMACLFELQDADARVELLDRFKESSSFWFYSRALHGFDADGASELSAQHLRRARRSNPYIADTLVGLRPLMPGPAQHYGDGDLADAVYYLELCLHFWLRAPGAIEWVRETLRSTPGQR